MLNDATAAYEDMGPSLLAMQPPSPTAGKPKPPADWTTIFTHLESRMGALRAWRWSWWAYWRVLAEFFLPRRYIWLVVANRMSRGSPVNDSIIDSTGQLAVRTCRSGMWTGLCSPSRPWFKLGVGLPWAELDADGKAWLEDTEKRAYTVFAQSNFYSTMAQAFEDEVVFGQAPIIIYEDAEDVARFYLPCCGEYYLQLGARLSTDGFWREFTLTVAQIVEQFTLDNCPEAVQKLWLTEGAALETEFVVCHAIEPNFPLNGRGRRKNDKIEVVPAAFTWRELYWLKGVKTDRPLSRRGFHSKPFVVLAWSKTSNDAYARSPCMDALGDNKQSQLETKRKAEFIEKGVRPPMGADPELKNEPASIMPGMITYFRSDGQKKGFHPLFEPNPQWLVALTADIDKVNARIEKCLFVDLFMAISRMEGVQPRNELELTKRDLERLQELGPVVDLAEKEFDVIIGRVLEIMQRRRMLKPLPKSLEGVPLKINYVSIMRLAQKAAEMLAMKDGFATGGVLSSAAKAAGVPDPLRVINLDKAYKHYLDLGNFPQDCVFTDDEVKEHDQIRHQELAKVQASQASVAAVNAAKTLSQTPIGGGTALSAMLPPGAASLPAG